MPKLAPRLPPARLALLRYERFDTRAMPSAGAAVVQGRRDENTPGYLAARAGQDTADAMVVGMLEGAAVEEGGRSSVLRLVEADSLGKAAGRAVGRAETAESQGAASESVSVGKISKEISVALEAAQASMTYLLIQCSLCWEPESSVERREIPVVSSQSEVEVGIEACYGRMSSFILAVVLLVHELCTLPSERRKARAMKSREQRVRVDETSLPSDLHPAPT